MDQNGPKCLVMDYKLILGWDRFLIPEYIYRFVCELVDSCLNSLFLPLGGEDNAGKSKASADGFCILLFFKVSNDFGKFVGQKRILNFFY